jgi:hypothetical protein
VALFVHPIQAFSRKDFDKAQVGECVVDSFASCIGIAPSLNLMTNPV